MQEKMTGLGLKVDIVILHVKRYLNVLNDEFV